MKRTILAHVENVPGILARVEGLFRRHSVPVESLHFDAAGTSTARLSIVARTSAEDAGLLVRQLRRLVNVREAHDATSEASHETVARLRPAG